MPRIKLVIIHLIAIFCYVNFLFILFLELFPHIAPQFRCDSELNNAWYVINKASLLQIILRANKEHNDNFVVNKVV